MEGAQTAQGYALTRLVEIAQIWFDLRIAGAEGLESANDDC